ncbi:hypothetical protein NFI96_028796, partial [Prochilodus magdalenae]
MKIELLFLFALCRLYDCKISKEGCAALASALKSNPSHLIELDLSKNEVGDAGVKELSDLLNHFGKLEILKLRKCCITEKGYSALASALESSSSSHQLELDLTENDPGDTGVKKITDPKFVSFYRLLKSPDAVEACKFLTETEGINPLLQRELDLSGKIQADLRVKQLSALLEDSHCRLQELRLNGNGIKEESCATLVSALHSNPSYLRKLDLCGNKLGKSGMEKLGTLLENPKCELEKLGLSDCSIPEEGWAAMVSAVEKNPTHLKELDLNNNKIEGSGLDLLSTLLKNPNCVLDTLKLSDCHITGDGYTALASALKSNTSSNLIELDLRGNNPGDNGMELLADFLQEANCKLTKPRLLKSDDAVQAHAFLSEHLKQDPLLLNELNLRNKKLDSTQMKQLSALLVDSHCKAKTLGLKCELTEDSCEHLATALISEDSKLTELNLSNSKLGGSSGIDLPTARMIQLVNWKFS